MQCTTELLENQFKDIGYPGFECKLILWIKDLKSFQINTGRMYTKDVTLGMEIVIYDPKNKTDNPFNISMEIPMDNLYIQVRLIIKISIVLHGKLKSYISDLQFLTRTLYSVKSR